MGYGSYDTGTRALRSATLGFDSKPLDAVFTQQKSRKCHEEMNPKNIKVRECRDSMDHPNVVPIILALDITGSMGSIPHMLIKDGLPKLMSGLIQRGVDASLCFAGQGDHECDSFPLQVGQFESGDEALDLWLTRTYIESGGGGNAGESYHLAWHFAVNKIQTDAWDKRKTKGFLFTVGDEPVLKNLPKSALKTIYGEEYEGTTAAAILEQAQEKFHVFHLHIPHGYSAEVGRGWKELLGQRCIEVPDYNDIPKVIINTVAEFSSVSAVAGKTKQSEATKETEEVIL